MIVPHAKRTALMIPVMTVSHTLWFLAPFPASGSPGTVSGLPAEFSVLPEERHTGKLPCFEGSCRMYHAFSLTEPKEREDVRRLQGPRAEHPPPTAAPNLSHL